jgi:hypothetical protein
MTVGPRVVLPPIAVLVRWTGLRQETRQDVGPVHGPEASVGRAVITPDSALHREWFHPETRRVDMLGNILAKPGRPAEVPLFESPHEA